MTEAVQLDIVVVGAGMAGLYFTWRMLKQRPSARIVVLRVSRQPSSCL